MILQVNPNHGILFLESYLLNGEILSYSFLNGEIYSYKEFEDIFILLSSLGNIFINDEVILTLTTLLSVSKTELQNLFLYMNTCESISIEVKTISFIDLSVNSPVLLELAV